MGYATYMVEVGEDKCGQELESCTWKVFKAAFFRNTFPRVFAFRKKMSSFNQNKET